MPEPQSADPTELRRFNAALAHVSDIVGLDRSNGQLLRIHGAAFYRLPHEQLVVRLVDATPGNRQRAGNALAVTNWLHSLGFPAVEPARSSPVEQDGVVATLWRDLPQPMSPPKPPSAVLGNLLRQLHALPDPSLDLPPVDPLGRLRRALADDVRRPSPVLDATELAFLRGRLEVVQTQYDDLHFCLGIGLIHGDAHLGNLLIAPTRPEGYVLADWDGTARGPRELDLVQEGAPDNHFGQTEAERREFSDAYGYDLVTWPGWPVLRDVRDLHSLAGHLRAAPTKPSAAKELHARLNSLLTGQRRLWRSVE